MRSLSPIILILFDTVDRLGDQFPMCNAITTKLIRDDPPRLSLMAPNQSPKEARHCSSVPLGLKINIDYLVIPKALAAIMGQALLFDGSLQVILLTVYPDKDFIDVEGITVASVHSFQAAGINGPNLIHQSRIASRVTVMPRSARRSSISRWPRLKR